jgi:hypothetical protein
VHTCVRSNDVLCLLKNYCIILFVGRESCSDLCRPNYFALLSRPISQSPLTAMMRRAIYR